ncbi:cyclophilin-like fold protein [Pseudokineococcus sp. 5B2Z-1]|uniref:cyclophilin-like fold protein n=1 Tax=Pseudokineococcus sp. 5B2Z-1 TaxID=3132744 RepID=UPI0030975568
MDITLTTGDLALRGTLHDTPSALDLASLLPMDLSLGDFGETEKVSALPRRLDTDGEPDASTPDVGDIAYYAPWGNLAIFIRPAPRAQGLIRLGHLNRAEELIGLTAGTTARLHQAATTS